MAQKYSDKTALFFMGAKLSFSRLIDMIDQCAAAFTAYGIKPGDCVLQSMPNVPNALLIFYALNKLGVRVAMTHPLYSSTELAEFIRETNSVWCVTVDMFYNRFKDILRPDQKLLVTRISDFLPGAKKVAFNIIKGRQNRIPEDSRVIYWKDFLKKAEGVEFAYQRRINPEEGAVVLFSGGTTNLPKGILLSSYNFNALSSSIAPFSNFTSNDSVIAILPVFHGFGLGICIHSILCNGGTVYLEPKFSTKIYIDSLRKHQPTFIAGVPTMFEAMLRDKSFSKGRFDRLRAIYCGGDSLSPELKARFDERLYAQGSKVELVEGYGLTETVTGCVLTPPGLYRKGAIGVPMPNMLAKIVDINTKEELPYGEVGEIALAGPTVMLEYINNPEETAKTIRTDEQGIRWLYTGDIGYMDEDGYLYFKSREKRMLKVSGVSVYPMQVEQVLESHELVFRACVVGVPDDYQMTSVKAYVVLEDPSKATDETKRILIKHCQKHLIKWSVPRAIEFRDKLPTTLVGKVEYSALEKSRITAEDLILAEAEQAEQ
ncbi:MAG: long-chain fatty acid--CoA ligase, partial [Christensenellaceae bacterium]|nr:long-chain fatty acid--CoA ligase [Christensenellaceae bacterium]